MVEWIWVESGRGERWRIGGRKGEGGGGRVKEAKSEVERYMPTGLLSGHITFSLADIALAQAEYR